MSVTWSQIHAALGEPPGELTFALVKAAVDQRVAEAEDLDWKQVLPSKEEKSINEFAKDVAAMANTRGGLLVYGVEEERGKGSAKAITSVDISEGAQRRLRQLAHNRVHPMVAGLEFIPLSNDDGSETVLVLSVPRSPDAPHIIGQGEKLGVPYRHGPETQWMRERELERAYSDRFAARAAEESRLKELIAEASDQLDLEKAAWIVGAAAPRTPLPGVASPLTSPEVRTVLEEVLARTVRIAPATSPARYTVVRSVESGALNPRVGLRRWVAESDYSYDPDKRSERARIELHHDGTVVMAAAVDGWYGTAIENRNQVLVTLVESFAADFVALAETYARRMGGQAAMAARIDLLRGNSHPFAAVDVVRDGPFVGGRPEQPSWSRTVRTFRPVTTDIPAATDVEALRAAARDVAQDVLHQFGIPRLVVLP